jgi:hypothetical protein
MRLIVRFHAVTGVLLMSDGIDIWTVSTCPNSIEMVKFNLENWE